MEQQIILDIADQRGDVAYERGVGNDDVGDRVGGRGRHGNSLVGEGLSIASLGSRAVQPGMADQPCFTQNATQWYVAQTHPQPREVVIVVFDGVKLLDAAGPAEVFAE